MKIKFVEATNGIANWGKFIVARFDEAEWARRSAIEPTQGLIGGRGWTRDHILVLDLQTGEGAIFRPGGCAEADLEKHRIFVCPLFQPFLEWLYQQPDPLGIPDHVDLPDAPFEWRGHRRPGPQEGADRQ